jgi:voltage-gated potassium channel
VKNKIIYILGTAGGVSVISFGVYLFESGTAGASILTMGDALWFTLVTLTTVGYGDLSPTTLGGKIISVFLLFLSLGFLSLVVNQVFEAFANFKSNRMLGLNLLNMENHIILHEWDDYAKRISIQLVNSNKPVVILSSSKEHTSELNSDKGNRISAVYGRLDDLELCHVAKANAIYLNGNSDSEKLVHTINIRKKYPDIRIILNIQNPDLKETFLSAGANHVIPTEDITSKLVASYIFEPDVATYSEDLLASSDHNEDFDLQQFRVLENSKFINQKYGLAFQQFFENSKALMIGLARTENNNRKLYKNPDPEFRILKNDALLFLLNGEASHTVEQLMGTQEGFFPS